MGHKLRFPHSDSGQHTTQVRFGEALLEDQTARPGVGFRGLQTGNCVGRFAATHDRWAYETVSEGMQGVVFGNPLDYLSQILDDTKRTFPRAGIIGYIAYDVGFGWLDLEPGRTDDDSFAIPSIQFLVFDQVARDAGPARNPALTVPGTSYSPGELRGLAGSRRVRASVRRSEYLAAVRQIKRHIRDGDVYQANYTQAFDVETTLSGSEIYGTLAEVNPAPFAARLRFAPLRFGPVEKAFRVPYDRADRSVRPTRESDIGRPDNPVRPFSIRRLKRGTADPVITFPEIEIISSSPERFWRKRGASVETRPIKGTVARGATQHEDRLLRRALVSSAKDRAELLMITDLERNDLGMFADIGSVRVEALRRVRAFASVWHLESIVSARAPQSVGWARIMRCLFPGGSITGAPKRRAVEILRELEPVPRGVYCGAIGWVDSRGDADFSIAIRTMMKVGSRVRVYSGGGIVADSDPDAEYQESLIKVAPMLRCLIKG